MKNEKVERLGMQEIPFDFYAEFVFGGMAPEEWDSHRPILRKMIEAVEKVAESEKADLMTMATLGFLVTATAFNAMRDSEPEKFKLVMDMVMARKVVESIENLHALQQAETEFKGAAKAG